MKFLIQTLALAALVGAAVALALDPDDALARAALDRVERLRSR